MPTPLADTERGIVIVDGEECWGDIPNSEHPWTAADDEEVAAYAAIHTDEATFGGVHV